MSDPIDNRFYREPEPVETRTIHVYLADGCRGEPTPPVTIHIDKAMPTFDPTEGGSKAFYRLATEDAYEIANALEASLPGATLDGLLRELLHRRASQLRVPMVESKEDAR